MSHNIYTKLFTQETLLQRIAFWRTMGDKIIFTNGCFDILHAGHVHLLAACAQLGDRLIIGLNADASVKRLKGESRPINDEKSRAILLAALQFTDAIILFEQDTPETIIQTIRPDVLVKGGDWAKEQIVGSSFVESYGGVVKTISYLPGFSTTQIIARSK